MLKLALLLIASCAFSQTPPTDQEAKIAALQAENDSLKAQLAQLRLECQYQIQICTQPDLMRARIAVIEAAKKDKPVATQKVTK